MSRTDRQRPDGARPGIQDSPDMRTSQRGLPDVSLSPFVQGKKTRRDPDGCKRKPMQNKRLRNCCRSGFRSGTCRFFPKLSVSFRFVPAFARRWRTSPRQAVSFPFRFRPRPPLAEHGGLRRTCRPALSADGGLRRGKPLPGSGWSAWRQTAAAMAPSRPSIRPRRAHGKPSRVLVWGYRRWLPLASGVGPLGLVGAGLASASGFFWEG
jgi:hypothetical protein